MRALATGGDARFVDQFPGRLLTHDGEGRFNGSGGTAARDCGAGCADSDIGCLSVQTGPRRARQTRSSRGLSGSQVKATN
jgi:hypothetical protein